MVDKYCKHKVHDAFLNCDLIGLKKILVIKKYIIFEWRQRQTAPKFKNHIFAHKKNIFDYNFLKPKRNLVYSSVRKVLK